MIKIVEIDKIKNFPHPRENINLLGHKKLEKILFNSFMSNKMHHAWIILGQKGIGKASLAYKFAKFILEYKISKNVYQAGVLNINPNLDCISSQQIKACSHPSLFILKRVYNNKTKCYKQDINIDRIRDLKNFLNKTIDKNSWRIIIIDSADDLNINSTNSLLKSLEEPPKNTIFLIISSIPSRLLPTIRSRCQILKASNLSRKNIYLLLKQYNIKIHNNEIDLILFLGQGSIAKIFEIININGVEIYNKLIMILYQLPKISRNDLYKFATELTIKSIETKYIFFIEQYLDIISRVIKFISLNKYAKQYLYIPNFEVKLFQKLSIYLSLETLFYLWENSKKRFLINTDFNIDKKQTIITEFLELEKIIK